MKRKLFTLTCLLIPTLTLILHAKEPSQGIPFDGATSYLTQKGDIAITPGGFSVSAWVRPDRVDRSLAFLGAADTPEEFTLYFYNGVVRMLVANAPPNYLHATAKAPEVNQWTHFLGTYDGDTIRIYRNGKLAKEQKAPNQSATFVSPVCIGGIPGRDRNFSGQMNDLCLWNRVLEANEVAAICNENSLPNEKLVAHWSDKSVQGEQLKNLVDGKTAKKINASQHAAPVLINAKDDGFRGIWYYNQRLNNEYVFKYSGGLGTYCTNHYPFSVYAPKVDKTFFCYGGTDRAAHENDEKKATLLHEVSYYDHKTGKVARPTIVLDKKTDDAHDNPVMSIDEKGHIWVFSTSHGTGRPSYVSRSKKPYDIEEFELVPVTKKVDGQNVPMTNFSYFQVWNVPDKGFIVFFTTYDKTLLNDPQTRSARTACFMTSRDGVEWSAWQPLAGIVHGHYQNGAVWKDKKVGSSFNYHPHDPPRIGLNYRTNLYYIESEDFGKSWQTADGTKINVPLRDGDIECEALVRDYRSKKLNVYVMDMVYDQQGRPVIIYVTSKGFESGPENDPRTWCVASWNGKSWDFGEITIADNNYDYGSLFIDANDVWRIVGTPGFGPQAYNTGGEVSMWTSSDRGKSWKLERQLTENSELNHCFPRRTVNAHDDFYAIWADGHGRKRSKSRIYFCNAKGEVFRLPEIMNENFATPEKL